MKTDLSPLTFKRKIKKEKILGNLKRTIDPRIKKNYRILYFIQNHLENLQIDL